MSEELKRVVKDRDAERRQLVEETQASLPPEDRSYHPAEEDPCGATDDGFACSKPRGHLKKEHLAHGFLKIVHRWED